MMYQQYNTTIFVVKNDELDEISYEETEEEIIRLTCLQDEYRRVGEKSKADSLQDRIKYLEDMQDRGFSDVYD